MVLVVAGLRKFGVSEFWNLGLGLVNLEDLGILGLGFEEKK